MSKKNSIKPVVGMLGTTFVVSLAFSPVTNAETNPFALNDLAEGYMVADGHEGKCGEGMEKKAEGKCGEGKCGEGMEKKAEGKCGEGKCGEGMEKKAEGKCGEGKCGEGMEKKAEGKCGEGKCGDKKAEGKCGEGKCGGKGVDMQGNVVELGVFRYGGDDMAKYSDGKLATGVKDPAVCGTFSAAKCSVGHLSE